MPWTILVHWGAASSSSGRHQKNCHTKKENSKVVAPQLISGLALKRVPVQSVEAASEDDIERLYAVCSEV
jgi:hypothetical protein